MVPELGLFFLITAMLACLLSLGAGFMQRAPIQVRALRLSAGLIVAAFLLLAYSFYQVDLTLQIVYQHANQDLPALYRIGAVWGGHEGSMLLWVMILNGWLLFASFLPLDSRTQRQVLMVLSFVSFGFLLFLLFASNPFARYLPITPITGQDLNPFLQDPVMLIHPPILYMGYVGFVLPFALAMSALWQGVLSSERLKMIRFCVLIAWGFLTFGIALGSFWAYYELGWGGWWFWDPVENASLLPWIAGCALIHATRVSQTREGFLSWTLLLCILAFALAILGTFLVRSGALTSVHSFANDPTRGLFILCLLAVYVLPALVLYSLKAANLQKSIKIQLGSREGLILINNLILMIILATVLLGTLYPLVIESLGFGFISVGAPYFNALIVPMGLCLGLVLGYAQCPSRPLPWFSISGMILGFLTVGLAAFWFSWPFGLTVSVLIVLWIVLQSLVAITRARARLALRIWGMHLAHLGFAALILGIAVSSTYSIEDDVILTVGDTHVLGDYAFTLDSVTPIQGPNYTSAQADLTVHHDGELLTQMKPEKRFYIQRNLPIAQIALHGNLMRDLYVALAEPLPNSQWILRVQYKPLIRLIWLGAIMISLGALLAVLDRRSSRGGQA